MGLGRRKVRLEDQAAWVFNRMADVYSARPAYPDALIDVLASDVTGRRVLDVGAGIGHLALPLAARGFQVVALEPAKAMLDVLAAQASERRVDVRAVHGTAESIPIIAQQFDLIVVSDALHFLDAELAGREVARLLAPGGRLALIACGFGDTPYMRAVISAMEEAAPRRPRAIAGAALQFFKMARVEEVARHTVMDETLVDPETLTRILRSISFIGPAMNTERFAAFSRTIRDLPGEPRWARSFEVVVGRRG